MSKDKLYKLLEESTTKDIKKAYKLVEKSGK